MRSLSPYRDIFRTCERHGVGGFSYNTARDSEKICLKRYLNCLSTQQKLTLSNLSPLIKIVYSEVRTWAKVLLNALC